MENLKYVEFNLRPASALTASFVASDVIGPKIQVNPTDQNQLMLYVALALATITTCTIITEFSADKVTWYQETLDETTAGSGIISERLGQRDFTANGNYRIAIPIKDQYIRIRAKGNIADASSSLKIDVIEGTA